MELINIIEKLPEKYKIYGLISIALLPYFTRAYYALKMNGGLKGMISAVWFGTNSPKSKDHQ